eukprot:7934343-Lingulodinium_polyedra.AAC.1
MVRPFERHNLPVEMSDKTPYQNERIIIVGVQINRNKEDRIHEGMPYVLIPAFNNVALPKQGYGSMRDVRNIRDSSWPTPTRNILRCWRSIAIVQIAN